jgi:hypothetical protein
VPINRAFLKSSGCLGEVHAAKVDLYLHQQGIDTTTPGGKALFQMMGVFAEFRTIDDPRTSPRRACASP